MGGNLLSKPEPKHLSDKETEKPTRQQRNCYTDTTTIGSCGECHTINLLSPEERCRSTSSKEDDACNLFSGRMYDRDVFWLSEALANHAHKWKEIGIALGFSSNELDVIATKPSLHVGAPNSWLREMLSTWVQWTPETQHHKYATIQDLTKALQSRTVGLGAIAEDIQEKVTGVSDQSKLAVDSPCERYAFYLRSYYTRDRKPDDKWPGIDAKEYTNLSVISNEYKCREDFEDMRKATVHGSIDDALQGRNCIDFEDILKPNDVRDTNTGKIVLYAIKQVLMEGAPGIGKSTMAWELCRKWGNGELFQEYSLVVMLRFRDPWVQKVKVLSDLFRFPGEPELQEEIAKEIKQTQGNGLLFILEGYDEAPPTLREPHSFFSGLFKGKLLPNATVLVTSRPSATQYLRQICKGKSSRRIEVLGFEKKEIESYIKSHFTETKSRNDFHKYLESYPHISSMMYVPLNAAIVTHVYQTCKTTSTIVPQTMTELYTTLVKTLLLRYMKEILEYENIQIGSFADLPKPVYETFREVCRLAYDGIVQPVTQIIFSALPEEFNSLGLMQSVPELYIGEGASFSYNFLHLTVQEFLAAYHLSLLGEDQVESFLPENATKHAIVCRFLAGLSQNDVSRFCRVIIKQTSSISDDQVSLDIPALLMLFELHNPDAIANMLQSKTVIFRDVCKTDFGLEIVYPFDYYALGYCICVSNCSWTLTFSHAGSSNLDMLAKALFLFNEQPTRAGPAVTHDLTIIGVNGVSGNRSKATDFEMLRECMRVFPNLQKLCLCERFFFLPGCSGKLIISLPESVTYLEMECACLDENECVDLENILAAPSHCIKHLVIRSKLSFGYTRSTCSIVDYIAKSISSLVSLHLEGLHNEIGDCGASTLANVLVNNSNMESLSLPNNAIGDEGATALAHVLESNSTLKCLNLEENRICNDGVTALAKGLGKNLTLESINLKCNHIGDDGAAEFAHILEYNSTLKILNLAKKLNR